MLLVAGLAVAAAGCRGDDGASAAGRAAPGSLPRAESRLDLVAWPGLVEDGTDDPKRDWVTPFERATGCDVHVREATSSDDIVALLRTGKYDGGSVPGDGTMRLVASGSLAPVNTRLVPRFADVYPALRRTQSNSAGRHVYGVPQGRGANLLAWRTDVVRPAPASWSVVYDAHSPYKGKVTGWDGPLSFADAAVYLRATRPDLGIENPYELDGRQFTAAARLLQRQRQAIGNYWSDYVREQAAFSAGTAVVGTMWQFVVDQLRANRVPVRAVLPREGSTGFTDAWAVARGARHPGCMYRWMNWMLAPRVNAAVAGAFGMAPSTPKACAFTPDRRHCARYHANDDAYWRRIALWQTPQRDCGDARGMVCRDYAYWTEAWDRIDR